MKVRNLHKRRPLPSQVRKEWAIRLTRKMLVNLGAMLKETAFIQTPSREFFTLGKDNSIRTGLPAQAWRLMSAHSS